MNGGIASRMRPRRPSQIWTRPSQDAGSSALPNQSTSLQTGGNVTGEQIVPVTSQRATLTSLPVELIEDIAHCLRLPWPDREPGWEDANLFLASNLTSFSHSLVHLSALSQVCSFLRKAVERVFYRDIFVSKERTYNPSGRMHLLVRTLEGRPELGRFIQSISLEHPPLNRVNDGGKPPDEELAIAHFFNLCTGLQRLVVSSFPFRCLPPNISTLAMKHSYGCLPLILFQLPNLRDLYLFGIGNHEPVYNLSPPPHRLQKFRFDSARQFPNYYFAQLLELCGDTVEDVYISGLATVSWIDPSPANLSSLAISNVRRMRLNDYFILANLSSRAAVLLRNLPALQHLHYSGRAPIHPNAFAALPLTLRSFTISGYAVEIMPDTGFKPGAIVLGVSRALATSAARSRTITSVTVHGCDVSTPATMINYTPLQDICVAEGIPYFRIGEDTGTWDMEIRIIFS